MYLYIYKNTDLNRRDLSKEEPVGSENLNPSSFIV